MIVKDFLFYVKSDQLIRIYHLGKLVFADDKNKCVDTDYYYDYIESVGGGEYESLEIYLMNTDS